MEEYPIKNTTLIVDSYANLYDYSTKSIITSEFIYLKDRSHRVSTLIANTYIEYGRPDLLKHLDTKVYYITSPNGARYYSLNLAEFSREHGLNVENMYKAAQKGYQTREGWKVESLN